MRKTPPNSQAWQAKADNGRIVMDREYRLLTPLYGGGVKAGIVDTETPIHGTGIRGQLRFWWRATRGARYSSLAELKAAEDDIWGSTKKGASKVSIAVLAANHGNVLTLPDNQHGEEVHVGDIGSPYSYVAFPLRESKGQVYENVTFTMQISLPSGDDVLKEDVQAALWAWETFGGVGARTRRGFGAVDCTAVSLRSGALTDEEVNKHWLWRYHSALLAEQDLMNKVKLIANGGDAPANLPHLSQQQQHYRITRPSQNAKAVWEHLVSSLKSFRQSRSSGQYGRSNWPEPDAIRDITKSAFVEQLPNDSDKEPRDYTEAVHDPRIRRFPRAAFGLPIIFEFKDGPTEEDSRNRDPRKTTLTLKDYSQLASPLIIRPVACRDNMYVGLATILQGASIPEGQLTLKEMNGEVVAEVDADLSPGQARQINALHPSQITTDILQSFLDSLS